MIGYVLFGASMAMLVVGLATHYLSVDGYTKALITMLKARDKWEYRLDGGIRHKCGLSLAQSGHGFRIDGGVYQPSLYAKRRLLAEYNKTRNVCIKRRAVDKTSVILPWPGSGRMG